MHDNILIFDGVQTDEFSTFVTNAGMYKSPSPDYEAVEIAGRNGNPILENDRYKNVSVTYPMAIYEEFDRNYMKLRSFFLSKKGYKRIEDSFEPDRYRVGRFKGTINPKYSIDRRIGTFEVEFDCKPQWYLKVGEMPIEFSGGETAIFNPTQYGSQPKYRVYGSGTFTVNDVSVSVGEGATEYVDIDCEIMDSYEGNENRNSIVTRTGGWPVLDVGANTLTMSGIDRIEIFPRWYVL